MIRRFGEFFARVLRRGLGAIQAAWLYGRVIGLNLLGWVMDPVEERRLKRRVSQGEITCVACLVPFERLEFHQTGIVTSCCPAYTREVMVGNMRRGSIESIWNGRAMRRLRRRLLLGDTRSVCRPNCPFLAREPIAFDALKTWSKRQKLLSEDLVGGRTRLTAPPGRLNLANSGNCNLRCIMCGSNSAAPPAPHVWKTGENIQRYFDGDLTLVLTGNGDPLARPDTRQMMMQFDSKRFPDVKFEILTNGLLWTAANWEKVRHCRFGWLNISVDASCAATYEKIRRGGRWDVLMKNFEVIRAAFAAGHFFGVTINMTVMRSNYREIPAFVALADRLGFHVSFAPIRGRYGDENIFELQDAAALAELRGILKSVDCSGGTVDLNAMVSCFPAGW